MLSLVLAIAGIALLIWHRKISQALYDIQRPACKLMFGKFLKLEKPWFQNAYKAAVIFAGIVLLLMAFALYFGPISL